MTVHRTNRKIGRTNKWTSKIELGIVEHLTTEKNKKRILVYIMLVIRRINNDPDSRDSINYRLIIISREALNDKIKNIKLLIFS